MEKLTALGFGSNLAGLISSMKHVFLTGGGASGSSSKHSTGAGLDPPKKQKCLRIGNKSMSCKSTSIEKMATSGDQKKEESFSVKNRHYVSDVITHQIE
jgi:hypothetical protein